MVTESAERCHVHSHGASTRDGGACLKLGADCKNNGRDVTRV